VWDVTASAAVLAVIGGVVQTGAPPEPVGAAWVELLRAGSRLRLARTDGNGRFRFEALPPGPYQLRASSATLGPTSLLPIDVPSPTGTYDIFL
jgi:hypothetical protein